MTTALDPSVRRRRLLRSTGAVAAAAIAGCIGGRPGSPTATPTGTPDEPAASFAVTATRCGTQADRVDVSGDGGSVTVVGTTWGNDACYTAWLEDVAWDGDTLRVEVITGTTADVDESCAQCLTEIDYRATIDVSRSPSTVAVTHDGEVVTTTRP